jgi:hypothetical protein
MLTQCFLEPLLGLTLAAIPAMLAVSSGHMREGLVACHTFLHPGYDLLFSSRWMPVRLSHNCRPCAPGIEVEAYFSSTKARPVSGPAVPLAALAAVRGPTTVTGTVVALSPMALANAAGATSLFLLELAQGTQSVAVVATDTPGAWHVALSPGTELVLSDVRAVVVGKVLLILHILLSCIPLISLLPSFLPTPRPMYSILDPREGHTSAWCFARLLRTPAPPPLLLLFPRTRLQLTTAHSSWCLLSRRLLPCPRSSVPVWLLSKSAQLFFLLCRTTSLAHVSCSRRLPTSVAHVACPLQLPTLLVHVLDNTVLKPGRHTPTADIAPPVPDVGPATFYALPEYQVGVTQCMLTEGSCDGMLAGDKCH